MSLMYLSSFVCLYGLAGNNRNYGFVIEANRFYGVLIKDNVYLIVLIQFVNTNYAVQTDPVSLIK